MFNPLFPEDLNLIYDLLRNGTDQNQRDGCWGFRDAGRKLYLLVFRVKNRQSTQTGSLLSSLSQLDILPAWAEWPPSSWKKRCLLSGQKRTLVQKSPEAGQAQDGMGNLPGLQWRQTMEGTAVDVFISDGHTALIHEMNIHENSLRQAFKEVKRAAERIIAEITFSSAIIIYCQRTDRCNIFTWNPIFQDAQWRQDYSKRSSITLPMDAVLLIPRLFLAQP